MSEYGKDRKNDQHNDQEQEKAFVDKARSLLEKSTTDLDSDTLRSLKQARMKALDSQTPVRKNWLIPVGGLAVTASLVAIISINVFTTNLEVNELPDALNDIELLTATDSLEFYAWLDEQNKS